MKFPFRTAFIVGIVAVLLAVAIERWLRAEQISVRLYTVAPGTVEQTVANTRAGTVKACQRAKLAPNAGGQVTVLNVTEGSRAGTGDVLLELWHADLDAQLAMQEAEARAARDQARETCLIPSRSGSGRFLVPAGGSGAARRETPARSQGTGLRV